MGQPVIGRIAGLLLLAAATWYSLDRWALTPLHCIHAARVDGFALNAQRGDYEARLIARRIRNELTRCECVTYHDAVIPFTLGAASEVSGDSRAAIAHYQRALTIDRRPEIYFRLGMTQLDASDHAAAIENLTRAIAFAPALMSEVPYKEIRDEIRQRLK